MIHRQLDVDQDINTTFSKTPILYIELRRTNQIMFHNLATIYFFNSNKTKIPDTAWAAYIFARKIITGHITVYLMQCLTEFGHCIFFTMKQSRFTKINMH